MAQHDYVISNASFPNTRSDINNVLTAINTCNSGTSRPSSATIGTIWLDSTNASSNSLTLKFYDGAQDISLANIDTSANTVDWLDSSVSIADNSITLAKMASGTDGNIISYDASGNPVAVATGSSGQVLTSAGAGAPPTFSTVTVPDNAITLAKMASGTDGNIISYDTSGNPVAVATGSSGHVLTSAGAGAIPSFQASTGGTNTPAFHAHLGAVNISDQSWTKIIFTTERFDTDSAYNTSDGKFTVPSGKGGIYLFGGIHRIENDNGRMVQKFYKNGNALSDAHAENEAVNYSSVGQCMLFNLSAGDYIEYYAYNSVGNTNGLIELNFFGFKLI